MGLTAWIDTLLVEIPRLWQCFKSNTYPASFLTNALGLGPETCARLPRMLVWFAAIYLGCGAVSVLLCFRRKQRSLNSVSHQINTAILVCCAVVFVPLLVYLARACVYVIQHEVSPPQGMGDLLRCFSEAVSKIFYMVLAFAGVLFTVWMPVSSLLRYLKVYRLWGVPHGIFDVGFGLYLADTALLAAYYADRRLYALILPAVLLLAVIQRSGYIPEERNVPRGADPAAVLKTAAPETAEAAGKPPQDAPGRSPGQGADT